MSSESSKNSQRDSIAPLGPIALAGMLIVGAIAVAYANCIGTPFIFDDYASITRNASIQDLTATKDVLLATNTGGASVAGRPIVNLSFALNYAVGGDDVRGYHVVNIAIHILAALALFGIVRRTFLLPALRERWRHASLLLGAASALLWGLHPLLTESVTCVVQRTESLAGLFFFLIFYGFVRAVDSAIPRFWFGFSFVFCLVGIATKELMFAAPVLVLLFDRAYVAGTFREAWRAHRGLHLLLFATWIPLFALMLMASRRGGTVGFGLGMSPWHYLLKQCEAIVVYLRLALWPHPLILDYGTDVVRDPRAVLPQGLLLLVLFGATLFGLWRRPRLGFVGAWFFCILAPSSSIVPLVTQTMAEHRMYLPLAAIVIGGATALYAIAGHRIFAVASAVIAIALGVATAMRNHDYASDVSIWSDTVAKRPQNARAQFNLGNALYRADDIPGALQRFREALRLQPQFTDVHYNFAIALGRTGALAEAAAEYEIAIKLGYGKTDAHINLGQILVLLHRRNDAIAQFQQAVKLDPAAADARVVLAALLIEAGRVDEGLRAFAEAARIQPAYAPAQKRWGNALVSIGRASEAVLHFEAALRLNPNDAETHTNLGSILAEAGKPHEALPHFQAAATIDPENPGVQANLGSVLVLLDRVAEGRKCLERALAIDPNFAPARDMLAQLDAAQRANSRRP